MAITKYTGAINTIQNLSDRPNQNEGLSAAQIKLKFDQSAIDTEQYLNDILTPELDDLDAENVKKTGDQTIAGVKTFNSSPFVPTPNTDMQASTKKYVDDSAVTRDGNLNTHKASNDHDGRYYTETELNNGQLDTRYYTETELGLISLNNSGASKIGITPVEDIAGTNVQSFAEGVRQLITEIEEVNANAEVVVARKGENTLGDKIDLIDASLAEMTYQSDITVGNGIPANKNYSIEYLRTRQAYLFSYFYRQLRLGQNVTICNEGDSITYGFDAVSGDKRPASSEVCPNGDLHTTTRASITYPEALQTYLTQVYGNSVTVVNRGYSGDGAELAYNRWITPSGANITTMNFGINDSRAAWIGYHGDISEFIKWYEKLIAREILRDSAVVILTPIKQSSSNDFNIDTFSNALYLLGQKYNVPVINFEEMLLNYGIDCYSEGVHLNGKGYNILGARLASLFIGEGCHKPVHVQNGSKLLTRATVDNIVYINGATSTSSAGTLNTPAEAVTSQGIVASISSGQSIIYSFYADNEDLLVIPSTWVRNATVLTVDLDFNIEQPDYSNDTILGLSSSFSSKPASSYVINNTTGASKVDNSTGITSVTPGNFIVIATKGWHTLSIKTTSGDRAEVQSIEFMDYLVLKNKFELVNRLRGHYKGLTHTVYNDGTNVTSTVITVSDIATVLNLESFTEYWRGVPLKLVVYNYGQSILEYIFMFGDLGNSALGWDFVATPIRNNLATTPTERTVSGVTYNATTKQITINWSGTTTRAASYVITVL